MLILIPLPDARSIFSELVQESVPSFQIKVLLPSDEFNIIPPSSTAASFPTVPSSFLPKSIFLSSTTKVVTAIEVCVPLTTRLPSMFTSPPTSKVLFGDALKIPTLPFAASTLIAEVSAGLLTINSMLSPFNWFATVNALFVNESFVLLLNPTVSPSLFWIVIAPVVVSSLSAVKY